MVRTAVGRLPLYRTAVAWDQLYAEYPVPDQFADTTFLLARGQLEDLQERRFKESVAAAWDSSFYRRRWMEAGVARRDVISLGDITRLPSFDADDIRKSQAEAAPYGDMYPVQRDDLFRQPIKLQTSGGTVGRPRPTLYGPVEWELNALTCARGLYVQGARPGDVLQVPLTLSLANYGWAYYKAAHDYLGILPLTTGSGNVTPSRRQLEIAFEYGTNLWASFPEYLTRLGEACANELQRPLTDLRTKLISTCLGPDMDESLRHRLERSWGCPVYDTYGTHEMGLGAFECRARKGLHLMEDCIFAEVVDVEAGRPVAPGNPGNLVVSVFFRRLPPIIRYNLRDLVRVVATSQCDCGSSFRRIDHFLGRSDDMVKLRGVNVYPMACLPAVVSEERTTGEWLCVVDRRDLGGVIRDELTVLVEVHADRRETDAALQGRLERRLREDLGLRSTVELVAEGSLMRFTNPRREGKVRRLLDRRYAKAGADNAELPGSPHAPT